MQALLPAPVSQKSLSPKSAPTGLDRPPRLQAPPAAPYGTASSIANGQEVKERLEPGQVYEGVAPLARI